MNAQSVHGMHQKPPFHSGRPVAPAPAGSTSEEPPLVIRIGTVIAGGVAASMAASLPPVMRIGDGGNMPLALVNWVALAGLLLPLAIIAVAVLRRGRAGVQLLVGDGVQLFIAGLLWWAVTEIGLLSVFGAVLRAKTHHHGLAGVTFAVVAVGSAVFVGLVAWRGARVVGRFDPKVHRLALFAAGGAALIELTILAVRTSHADALRTTSMLVDVFALVLASAMASSRLVSRLKPVAFAGAPFAVLVFIAGSMALYTKPELRASLPKGAPLHAVVLGSVSSMPQEPVPPSSPPLH